MSESDVLAFVAGRMPTGSMFEMNVRWWPGDELSDPRRGGPGSELAICAGGAGSMRREFLRRPYDVEASGRRHGGADQTAYTMLENNRFRSVSALAGDIAVAQPGALARASRLARS